MECDIDVNDMSKLNKVIAFGTTLHKFTATKGDQVPALSYHLPLADIYLFSSQAYHQLYDGSSEWDGNKVGMYLKQQPDMSIRHDIKIYQTNLLSLAACTKKELNMIGPHFKSAMVLFNCNTVFNH